MNKHNILIPLAVAAMMLPMTADARTVSSCCYTGSACCESSVKPACCTASSPVPSAAKESQVLAFVNQYRANAGAGMLRRSSELDRAAAIRAQEIAQYFSHTRPDGSSWSTVSDAAYGENIAKGHTSAEKAVLSWMNSPGHRENILRGSYGSIGIAAVEINGAMYWVQLFGR